MVVNPFEKENELAQFKKDISKLEREISIKIQENQMKQHNDANEIKEATVIRMEKSLLPKKGVASKKAKGIRI